MLSGIPAVLISEIDKFSHKTIYLRFIFFKNLNEYLLRFLLIIWYFWSKVFLSELKQAIFFLTPSLNGFDA